MASGDGGTTDKEDKVDKVEKEDKVETEDKVEKETKGETRSQVLGLETRLDPLVERLDVGALQTKEEGHGAAMQVARVGAAGGVDIGVGVDLS
jgi:hypothetical protein